MVNQSGMDEHLAQQRANELVKLFRNTWGKGVNPCDAMRAVAQMPCARFYINAETVKKQLRKKQQRNRLKILMLREITTRCGENLSIDNIETVIQQPAPQFYITPETARKLIQAELKRRRLQKK